MAADMIWLRGIECRVKIGVTEAERKRRQRVEIDLGVELDLAEAGRSDDFRATADYWALERAVRDAAESGERRLVEALAEGTAELALAREPRARAVEVRVRKRPAVMPRTRWVEVRIRRSRA